MLNYQTVIIRNIMNVMNVIMMMVMMMATNDTNYILITTNNRNLKTTTIINNTYRSHTDVLRHQLSFSWAQERRGACLARSRQLHARRRWNIKKGDSP